MLTLSQHFQNLAPKCNDSRSIQDKDAQSFKLSEMLDEERERPSRLKAVISVAEIT